jgi:integrase
VSDLTEDAIRSYIKARLVEGAGGRTINMEVGELSRAIGHKWSALWPKVRKLEERKEVGRALSAEEETRLLDVAGAQSSPNRSQTLSTFIRVALLTGMRAGEITSLTWAQVDFSRHVVTVGKAKSAAGTGRQIPMNRDLLAVFSIHADWFTKRFGKPNLGTTCSPLASQRRTTLASQLRTLQGRGRRYGKRREFSAACMT